MSFDLFGPATKCDIKVGYVSTDRGFVDRVGLHEANKYAKLNPGTTFVFKTREKVQYLNINEVNKLTPEDMIPKGHAGEGGECEGIVGLNGEGDAGKSIDEALGLPIPDIGGSSKNKRGKLNRDSTRVSFYGGGGVGVQANPIVGKDGSLMAVDVIHGGFGYKYPPTIDIKDDRGIGAGAVAKAVLKTGAGGTDFYMEEYDREEDFEEYDLEICAPQVIDKGKRYGPDGKELGDWDPGLYSGTSKNPIDRQIQKYQDFLASLKDGSKLDRKGNRILEWWTTRQHIPLKVVSSDRSSRDVYNVVHPDWGEFMDDFAISPVPPSNAKGTDYAGKTYTLEWEEDFPWEGEYRFRVQADDDARLYIDNKPVTDAQIGVGGNAGHVKSAPLKLTQHITPGIHKISLALLNHPFKENKKVQRDSSQQTSISKTSNEVTFKISSASQYGNGISFEGLGIDVAKEYKGPELKETITKTVEYGRPYTVKLRSGGTGAASAGKSIIFTRLNASNSPITVTNNGTRLALTDDDGQDINTSFTIDKGSIRFSSDGRSLLGSGTATFTLTWNDNPRSNGKAVDSIKIGDKIWAQTGNSGSVTKTVTIGGTGAGKDATIQLKTKGDKVLGMESAGEKDYNELVCSVSFGRFYDINGSACKFIVDPPSKKGSSTGLKDDKAKKVFNTVDWINKANRPLWKINPGAGRDANFLNRFGVLPFDPTDVGGEQKNKEVLVKNPPPSVKFIREDGRDYIKVVGTGKVKVFFAMTTRRQKWSGVELREIKIKTDEGDLILERDAASGFKETGSGVFTGGQKYLVKNTGGRQGGGSRISTDKTLIGYDDNIGNGFDENGNLKITAVTPITAIDRTSDNVLGNASTDDFAGTHQIVWTNVNFPADGKYSIESMVDDNATLTFSRPGRENIVLKKYGFKIRGDGSSGRGKSVDIIQFEGGSYSLKVELEQIAGKPLAKGNPMAIAMDIRSAFETEDNEVISVKSWNENPMGVALVIDSPMPNVPSQPPPLQEGRCPNNPIWSTRHPNGSQKWWPVRVDMWEQFMNRYAISPIAPLGFKGTDGSGIVYKNTWKINLPYSGFYGLKGTVDNSGRILIDGEELLGPNGKKKISRPTSLSPDVVKKYLQGGDHEISIEIENDKQYTWTTIDKKIFNTADWASKQSQTQSTSKGAKSVDVTFKTTSAALFGTIMQVHGLFEESKDYKGPEIKNTRTVPVETGRVYDVEFTSSGQRTSQSTVAFTGLNRTNSPINVTHTGTRLALKDDSGSDINAAFTIDKVIGGTARFNVDGKSIDWNGEKVSVTMTLSWNDNPRESGQAVDSIKIMDKIWTQSGRSGSQQRTVVFERSGNKNASIRLRNKGKKVVQMENSGDNSWDDLVCAASEGEFYDFKGRTCKYRVPSTDKTEVKYGEGLTSGSAKDGVSYDGPSLSTYANSDTLGPFITPTWTTDEEYAKNFSGKTWTMTWSNVDFPETGTYDIQAEGDDLLVVKLDGVEISKAGLGKGVESHMFNAPKGKRSIELTLSNSSQSAPFASNPTVAAVKITKKTSVSKIDPRTGNSQGKSWTVNPIGVSAILIPPPCPKKIDGGGIVTEIVVTDPGNGWTPPSAPGGSYPVNLELTEIVITNPGINYDCSKDLVCVQNTETGVERCLSPECGPFGQLIKVDIPAGMDGYTSYPAIRIRSLTGTGAQFVPKFKVIRDPIGIPDPDRLLQVTDLVGLKRTGFYDGKPYYGSVFYKDGIRYAGWYETPGKLVQIYDTMQESIDAEVTTPPSAILRQGSDSGSNNPKLDIPGTPNNLI